MAMAQQALHIATETKFRMCLAIKTGSKVQLWNEAEQELAVLILSLARRERLIRSRHAEFGLPRGEWRFAAFGQSEMLDRAGEDGRIAAESARGGRMRSEAGACIRRSKVARVH